MTEPGTHHGPVEPLCDLATQGCEVMGQGPGGHEAVRGRVLHSCQRLRSLIDTIFDAYYDWDIASGTVDFSAQLGSFLGIDPDSLRTLEGWAERIHPEDRGRALRNLDESVHDTHSYIDYYRMQRADGTYALIRDRGVVLLDEAGRPSHLVGVMRDATLEQEAEKALRESADLYHTLFELAFNPAFHVGADGRYVNANQAGASFFGSTREDIVGLPVTDHWAPDTVAEINAVLADRGQARRVDADVEVGGAAKAVILTLVPCTVGDELACFVLATDITERQNLARTLEESNIALRVVLQQRDRARDELERTIRENLEEVVLPLLARASNRAARTPEAILIDTAMQNLRDIARPLAPDLDPDATRDLTRREKEVANLIRAGKTTAEIAQALYISNETVAFHRKNLRRKLGLAPRGTRLRSFLSDGTLRDHDGGEAEKD